MTQHNQSPVNLSDIDPPVWRVLAGDTVYGPYTFGQMSAFKAEGRIAADTRVADGPGAAFRPAAESPALAALFQPQFVQEVGEPANFLVATRIAGTRRPELIRTLNQLGRTAEIAPGICVLRSRVSLARIRAQVEKVAEKDDSVVIVDASHDRIGWLHLGPETDARVRQVWDSTVD